MSVKIDTSFTMGGMPTFEYSININGVTIGLLDDDFHELAACISKEISDDLKKAIQVKEKYWNNVKKIQELRKEIVSIFWECEDDSDIAFRKQVEEIDQDKLFDTLEKYNRFLGFE